MGKITRNQCEYRATWAGQEFIRMMNQEVMGEATLSTSEKIAKIKTLFRVVNVDFNKI